MVTVCCFSLFWQHFDLVKRDRFGDSGHFSQNAGKKWPELLYADALMYPDHLQNWLAGGHSLLNSSFWCHFDLVQTSHNSFALRRVLSSSECFFLPKSCEYHTYMQPSMDFVDWKGKGANRHSHFPLGPPRAIHGPKTWVLHHVDSMYLQLMRWIHTDWSCYRQC